MYEAERSFSLRLYEPVPAQDPHGPDGALYGGGRHVYRGADLRGPGL